MIEKYRQALDDDAGPDNDVYVNFVEQMQQEPELIVLAAKEVVSQKLQQQSKSLSRSILNRITVLMIRAPTQVPQWLQRNGFLDDLESFDPIMTSDPLSPTVFGPVFSEMVRFSRLVPGPQHDSVGIWQLLPKKQKETFGEQLLNRSWDLAEFLNMFGEELNRIKSLPNPQQERLSAFGRQMLFQIQTVPSSVNAKGKLARKFLLQGVSGSASPAVAKILNAESFEDLVGNPDGLWEHCSTVMKSMNPDEVEIFYRVLKKSIQLMDASSLRPDEYSELLEKPYFPTPRRTMHTRLFRQLAYPDAVRLYARAHDDGLFKYMGTRSDGVSGGEYRVFMGLADLVEKNRSQLKKHLKKDPNASRLPPLVAKLNKSFDGQNSTVIFPELVNAIGGNKGKYSMESGVADASSGSFQETWRWAVQASGVVYPAINNFADSDSPTSKYAVNPETEKYRSPPRQKDFAEYQEGLLKYVKDSNRALGPRCKVARFLASYDPTLPAEGVFDCIEVVVAANEDGYINYQNYRKIFEALLELSDHDRFKATSLKLMDSWLACLLNEKLSHDWKLRFKEFPAAVELLSKIEKLDLLDEFVEEFVLNHSFCEVGLVLELIKIRRFEPARKLCKKIWHHPLVSVRFLASGPRFTKQIEAAIGDFAKSFEDESLQYLGEVYFSAFENVELAGQRPESTLDQRLDRLAESYSDVFFENAKFRRTTMLALARATSPRTEMLEELGENIAPGHRLTSEFLQYAAASFRNNEYQPLIEYQEACNKAIADGRFANGILRTFVKDYLSSSQIAHCYSRASAQQKKYLAKAVARIADPQLQSSLLTQSNIMLHAINGNTDALAKEYQKNDHAQTEFGNHLVFHPNEVWEGLGIYISYQDQALTQEQRFQLVEEVLKMVAPTRSGIAGVPFNHRPKPGDQFREFCFYPLMRHGLLTEEEVLEHGQRFADLVSVNGDLYRHLGLMKLQQGKKEEASELLLKCYKRKTREDFFVKSTSKRYRSELFALYKQLGRKDKAKEFEEFCRNERKWRAEQNKKLGPLVEVPHKYRVSN